MKVDTNYPRKESVTLENSKPIETSLYKVPTESIELPSKGLVYPEGHPLRSGHIEMRAMTAREEDILTTESFIKDNTVLDRFLGSLIVTPGVDLDEMILGDISSITIAARISGYGPSYEAKVETPSGKVQPLLVDLIQIPLTYLDESLVTAVPNEFIYKLPASGHEVTFKLLTQKESKKIEDQLSKDKLQKEKSPILQKTPDRVSTTQLKYQIVAINGNRDIKELHDFIDNNMLAYDIRALRTHIKDMSPGVDLSVEVTDEETKIPFLGEITIGVQFFWPDAKV